MKNKKHFVIPIIIVILLLIVQAFCDLALPDYTSKIINNGIQNQGIEYSVPKIMPTKIYEAILKITNNNSAILASYDLILKDELNSNDFQNLSKTYPKIKEEDLYILKNINDEELALLENKIAKPLIIATTLYYNSDIAKSLNLDLPQDTLLLDYLLKLDKDTFNNIMENVNKQFTNLDDSMIKQMGIKSVNQIYQDIGYNLENNQISYIVAKGLQMLAIAFLGMIVAIIVGYLVSKIASIISYVLRKKVVTKIMQLSPAEFKEFGASSLITRSTNDIEQIKNFLVMLLRMVIFAPIIGIGAFIKVYHNPLNWLIGVSLIVMFFLISLLFSIALPRFKRIQKLIDKMNLVSRQIVTGMPVIRTFGTEKVEEKKFDEANTNLTNNNLFVNRLMGLMMPSMMLVMNVTSILIVWFGSKIIDLGNMQVGTLLAFITYTMQIIMAFLMISMISVMLPRALISFKRIKEILQKEISIKEAKKTKAFKKDYMGVVEFKDVSFKYPDASEALLKNISFKATPGTTTAFIGSTGSGKSTLINLIPRFYEASEGQILINGIDIKEANIKDLRDCIGYVPQKGILFSGTIASNLKLGVDNLSIDEMQTISEVSQSLEFIKEKENGFDSLISQGGSNVSGGQKQRLAIARALAKDADIYIFDDSFSALDFKTDLNVRKALKKYAKDATVLIVAQRISTIMNADNIIVLDEGKIVGQGKHKELLKNCQIYKEICLSQLKEEEL